MPPVSEAQRRLMFAAAAKKGGVGGVSQAVGQDFANADKGGKLPDRVQGGKPRAETGPERRRRVYNHPTSKKQRGDPY